MILERIRAAGAARPTQKAIELLNCLVLSRLAPAEEDCFDYFGRQKSAPKDPANVALVKSSQFRNGTLAYQLPTDESVVRLVRTYHGLNPVQETQIG